MFELIGATLLLFSAPVDTGGPPASLTALERGVDEAAIRADTAGLRALARQLDAWPPRHRNQPAALRARALTAAGLARYHLLVATNGQVSDAATLGSDALARAREAIAADSTAAMGFVLSGLIAGMASSPETAAAVTRSSFARARALAPADPRIAFAEALAQAWGDSAVAGRFERAARVLDTAAVSDWWRASAWAYLADARLGTFQAWRFPRGEYLAHRDPEGARAALKRALAVRPDFFFAQAVLLPLIRPAVPHPIEAAPVEGWTELTWDPVDGKVPLAPDAAALAVAVDSAAGLVWFRFDLHVLPAPDTIGINLALDVDDDSTNGRRWWFAGQGGNPDLRFDLVVTAWLRRTAAGWTGVVGASNAVDGARRRFDALASTGIPVIVDPAARRLYLAVPRGLLPGRRISLIGVLGTDLYWSDDLPNRGHVTVELPFS